jgi:hypothetical protein
VNAHTRDVHPEAVGDGSGDSLPERERVPSDKVGALAVGVVEGVEEVGGGRGEEVEEVLLQGIGDQRLPCYWVCADRQARVLYEKRVFLRSRWAC